jgi:hypothetical protein
VNYSRRFLQSFPSSRTFHRRVFLSQPFPACPILLFRGITSKRFPFS